MVISSSAVEEGEVDWSTDDDVDVVVAFTSGLAGGAKAMVEPTDMESSIRECKDFIVLCCYANLCIKLHRFMVVMREHLKSWRAIFILDLEEQSNKSSWIFLPSCSTI